MLLGVRQSFDRARRSDFAHRFYSVFLASDPAVRKKFENTDFEKQRWLLMHGVYSMLDYAEGKPLGKLALDRLAVRHGPDDLAIPVDMYEKWLTSFIGTLRVTDPEFNESLARDWIAALRPGIDRLAAKMRPGASRRTTGTANRA